MDDVFNDLFANARRSAVHLEMRDNYDLTDPAFLDWRAGIKYDPAVRWDEWFKRVTAAVARGVEVRRARIISEPVSEYVRYEYDVTEGLNLASGEQVRWLPRREASDLAVPGNDFWVFDGAAAVFNLFDGNGAWVGEEACYDGSTVMFLESAFAGVWARATDHENYRLG